MNESTPINFLDFFSSKVSEVSKEIAEEIYNICKDWVAFTDNDFLKIFQNSPEETIYFGMCEDKMHSVIICNESSLPIRFSYFSVDQNNLNTKCIEKMFLYIGSLNMTKFSVDVVNLCVYISGKMSCTKIIPLIMSFYNNCKIIGDPNKFLHDDKKDNQESVLCIVYKIRTEK